MKTGIGLSSEFLVEKETYSLLELLNKLQVKATMFVPGYVADRFPGLVGRSPTRGMISVHHGYGISLPNGFKEKGFAAMLP